MSKLKLAIVSIFLLVLFVEVSGQNFPVRVTPIITPPYSPFLTDYTEPGSDKLTLQVMLNDVTVSNYRCKFRLSIEGVNISITTNPNYLPAPITLQGGVPEIIYGSDIIDYFNPANLVYKGITQKEIEKNGNKLPEGVYRFTFEVLDYNRNLVVSNKGTVTAWMLLNDPPFINLPANNAKLKPFDPQNIVFQWTPRHRGSPNSAFTTEYEVKLVEIWPKGRNPYDAINTTRPIFETTTDATMVVYGPAETPLVLGREYALQVKAKDTGGKDLFKNNGYSEVVKFTYGDECPPPTSLLAEDIGTVKARIKWQGNGMNTGYTLRYRQKQQGAEWFEERTNQSYFNAIGIQPGTVYEYEVGGECETFLSAYVGGQVFTTLIEDPNAFVCGDPNAVPKLDNSPPLPALMINDFIQAGGFDVVVSSATGSNGQFSGTGQAIVPWFNSAKVRVTFENINVNTSYQLTGGTIKSVWDKDSKLLRTFEKTTAQDSTNISNLRSEIAGFVADSMVTVTGAIISVSTNSDGDIVVLNNEGETIVLEKGKSYAIADEVGNGYIVKEDGTILKTTATDASNAGARGQRDYSDDPNQSVRFDKSTSTQLGFDAKREGTLAQHYIQTTNDKYVAWKALSSGVFDEVSVFPEGATDLNRIKYRRQIGTNTETITASSIANGEAKLSLQGKTNATNEELLAIYTASDTSTQEVVAGQINLVSYDQLPAKNLVLVLVNKTDGGKVDAAAVQSQLNAIYKQALVSWNVHTTIQKIEVTGINENLLDDGESGMFSNYSGEMKQVLNAYLKDHTLATNTYYLFLLNNSKSGQIAGYMPRSKQAGFIFLNGLLNPVEVQKTMAHELGHGAFHLKHTFSESPSLDKGTTDNLMDYNGGIALNKYQWDYIHNPERVISLFEDDEEGEAVSLPCVGLFDDCDDVIAMLKSIKSHVSKVISSFPNLSVYMPTEDGKRKELYQGNYLQINGIDYKGILVKNELKKDAFINPRIYYSYDENVKINEDYKVGFEFKIDSISSFKIVVLSEGDSISTYLKAEQLRQYLFGSILPVVNKGEEKIESGIYPEVLIENITWVSQSDQSIFGDKACYCVPKKADPKKCSNRCCGTATKYILSQFGVTPNDGNKLCTAIKSSEDDYSAVIVGTDFDDGLDVLESSIKPKKDGGSPVMVGVHYPKDEYPGYQNLPCSATFHYVLIVGKGYDPIRKMNYFRFYDVGRSVIASGTSEDNKLYVDKINRSISGEYRGITYTLTEVRPNL